MHARQALYKLSYSPDLHMYALLTPDSQLLHLLGDELAAQGLVQRLAGLWLRTARPSQNAYEGRSV